MENKAVIEILNRKMIGIDCIEEESAYIKGYLRERFKFNYINGSQETDMLALTVKMWFQIEWCEAYDEWENIVKINLQLIDGYLATIWIIIGKPSNAQPICNYIFKKLVNIHTWGQNEVRELFKKIIENKFGCINK